MHGLEQKHHIKRKSKAALAKEATTGYNDAKWQLSRLVWAVKVGGE